MRYTLPLMAALLTTLTACSDASKTSTDVEKSIPFVKTVSVQTAGAEWLEVSGTVRARIETPLSFQVPGRIARRVVDAGQRVKAGDVLFELDRRDLEQGANAGKADLAAAQTALNTAESELARGRKLVEQNFLSPQALDRMELQRREAQTRRDAAAARATQSGNALGYGALLAPAAGVVMEVSAQSGQVVSVGQAVATLAQGDGREVELFLPGGITPPASGVMLYDGAQATLSLREAAGTLDPLSRTLRARYTIESSQPWVLGSVVKARFKTNTSAGGDITIPMGALDERGDGARVWVLKGQQVASVPVTLVATDGENVRVRGALPEGTRLVAMGTHLLTEGMAARELPR